MIPVYAFSIRLVQGTDKRFEFFRKVFGYCEERTQADFETNMADWLILVVCMAILIYVIR